jgi:hypothetical protein
MVCMLIGVVRHFHRVAIALTRELGKLAYFASNQNSPAMSTLNRRPEDRQRNGACDVGWCVAGPDCYRSEAFAEDLTAAPSPSALAPLAAPRGVSISISPSASASRASWSLLGASLAALLGASTPR